MKHSLPSSFTAAFVSSLPAETPESTGSESLVRALEIASSGAAAAWGKDYEADGEFARSLANAVAAESSPVAALHRLHGADLYLAHAALAGRKWATEALASGPLEAAMSSVRRRYRDDDLIDECRQKVLETVLVGERASLKRYAGQASMSWWLRVIALRTASRLVKTSNAPSESLDESLVADGDDELLGALKSGYRAAFRRAFADAVASLSHHDRLLLKQNALDGVSIDEIAAVRDVHRATAARWLQKIRDKVREATCRGLADELGLESGDIDGVLELVRSRLDASVSRLLADSR